MFRRFLKIGWVALSVFILGQGGLRAEPKENTTLRFVTVGIRSYREFREIKGKLRQIDGVESVKTLSESAGLQAMEIEFLAQPGEFFDKALSVFGDNYTLKEKKIPGGSLEINLARR